MPIHPEHVNIARRQSIRDLPDNPTPIHPLFYPGKRFRKLPALELGLPPAVLEEYAEWEYEYITDVRSPSGFSFLLKLFMVANDHAWIATPRLTGTYNITNIQHNMENSTLQIIYWGVSVGRNLPATFAEWRDSTRILLPTTYVGIFSDLIQWTSPLQFYQPLNHTVYLSNQALIFDIYMAGAQPGTLYAVTTVTLVRAG